MIALIQRVSQCSVAVGGETISSIGHGMLILLGVHRDDTGRDLALLVRKCAGLRIFPDGGGKMNLAAAECAAEALVVSQFTLLGDVRKGMRPYFGDAAEPDRANALYEAFIGALAETGIPVRGGAFGASMQVSLINDGPVTIRIDTRELA